jgi:hypothetical protein
MKNILFICGSINQTTQMHQISQHLANTNNYFTPYFADGVEDIAAKIGLLDFTVLGGRHRRDTLEYLYQNHLNVDHRGESREYDLVVTCSDLIIQKNIQHKKTLLVQEGITEPEGVIYALYKTLPILPRYLANTATAGLSDSYDLFCVASNGYSQLFIRKGVKPEKIVVTGIPNFDNLEKHLNNSFGMKDYVLVATTPYRESFRFEDRMSFLEQVKLQANGKPLIFKLHPSEEPERATFEILSVLPDARVFTHGNVNDMIANASLVITQQSTCTFVALALGKETHTYLNKDELNYLLPIQNGGISAKLIAQQAQKLLEQVTTERLIGLGSQKFWKFPEIAQGR